MRGGFAIGAELLLCVLEVASWRVAEWLRGVSEVGCSSGSSGSYESKLTEFTE